MDVAITGASGLIGSSLRTSLRTDGHRVISLVRGAAGGTDQVRWDPSGGGLDAGALAGVDAVVNLAGPGIGDRPWTAQRKRLLRDARVDGTRTIAEAVAALDPPPVLVSGSGMDYYGDPGDREVTEDSPSGDGFLAELCRDWEAATVPAAEAGARVTHLRTAPVLSAGGGVLPKIIAPFRFGVGGRLGRGDQWFSWITLDDMVRAIRFLLDHDVSGPVNMCSPGPVTNAELTKAIGRALHRPTAVPVPRVLRRLPFGVGEMLDDLLFTGAKLRPAVLEAAGFEFHSRDIDAALASVLGTRSSTG
jgi:uncharacterized protein (TIGR01777 family)